MSSCRSIGPARTGRGKRGQEHFFNAFFMRSIKRLFRPDYVVFDGSRLPRPELRWCGHEFKDNAFYVHSAEVEAKRVLGLLGSHATNKRVLDIGCGQGRLAIGLLRSLADVRYDGFDIHKTSIKWCKKYIQTTNENYRFIYMDVSNERYNSSGKAIENDFRLPFANARYDLIYLYSVFSHMREADMRAYVGELGRLLKRNGKVFLTTYIEEFVPHCTINPENYIFRETTGPLHIVRYEKNYLFNIFGEQGFIVDGYSHATETDSQSTVCLSKTDDGVSPKKIFGT